jgi:hypothetical protein
VTIPGNFDALLAELSDAVFDAAQWEPALERLTDTVGAVGTVMLPPPGRRFAVLSTDALAGANDQYIKQGWSTRDRRDRGIPMALRHGVAVDQDFVTEEEMARSGYYNDFLGRHNLRWSAIMATASGDGSWVTSIQRSSGQGPFVPDEQAQLAALRWPLSCTLTVSSELRLARARGLAEAFDILGSAAVVLDWRGEVILVNRTADATLTSELRITGRRLVRSDPEIGRRLVRLVGQVTSSWPESRLRAPVAVPRTGSRPLLIYGVPLHSCATYAYLSFIRPRGSLGLLVSLSG